MTTKTTTTKIQDQKVVEKQMNKQMGGCMSGFFNIFDRSHQRLYPKRLPPPPHVVDSVSEPVSSTETPALSKEFEKPKPKPQQQQPELKSPLPEKVTPASPNAPSPGASPWKFAREAPRLSLDSRAITDGKGGLKPREIRFNTGSSPGKATEPSVIARLMGLEPLPSSGSSGSGGEPEKKSVLRRSASESRSKDYRFGDTQSSFLSPSSALGERKLDHPVVQRQQNDNGVKRINQNNNNNSKNQSNNNQRRLLLERKSYYDTADFFPADVPAKQHQSVSIYGEIEKRLKRKGMDEPSKDLESLKHILEALQLKGLLHSSSTKEESPVVLMKPARPTSPTPTNRRRNCNVASSEKSSSPRRERPGRSSSDRSSSPTLRRKGGPLSVETQRRSNETTTMRRERSPVQSPRLIRRSDQTVSRSPRGRRPTADNNNNNNIYNNGPTCIEDDVSIVSASTFSTSSYTDNERWRIDEYKDGKNLLERCDKLLNNIAEITANSSSNSNSNSNSAELQQPSPVSVLDSSFYKEDESSPSPVKKRTIDFKDQAIIDFEEGIWSPSSPSTLLLKLENDIDPSEDSELSYVSEVIRASNYLPDDDNLFFLLEKQSSIRGIGRDKSKASVLQRKLTFDTVTEILDRNRQLPPWKSGSGPGMRPMLDQIWTELKKIDEHDPSEDLLEVICGVLKKDLERDSVNGWTDHPLEMSEAVLDVERLIFKDLIGETITDLASLDRKSEVIQALCRKLVF